MTDVTDATGERDFVYDAETLELNWEQLPDGFFGERDVVRAYGGPVGRMTGLGIDVDEDGSMDAAEYEAGYAYDGTTGRMSRVSGPGLLSGSGSAGVFYSYLAGSNLVEEIEHRNSGGTNVARTTRAFEANRDLVASVTNDWLVGGTTTVSKYTYYNDSRGRRDGVVREGAAFDGSGGGGGSGASPEHYDDWGYNERNELTGQTRYNQATSQPTTQASDGQTYAYDYDPIGNRKRYDFHQGQEPEGDESAVQYGANALNQYANVRFAEGTAIGQRLFYDVDGNLTHAKLMADMDCNGSVNPFDIQIFTDALDAETGCNVHPENFCDCAAADMNGDGSVNPFDIQPFVDAMSGLGGEPAVPMVRFVWDGENRLREVAPLGETPAAGAVKWVYTYDYLGRRVAKQSFTWDDGEDEWDLTTDTRFVYDGWNVMEELNADANADGTAGDFEVIRKYTWGLDLSGQYGSRSDRSWAGGIGGLLATRAVTEGEDYGYLYDANGNVGQLVDLGETGATPVMPARYEYDPYGATVASSGAYAEENPYRFSTKYADGETGFYYYGYRYYSARLGQWLNRDLLFEHADVALYRFATNNPIWGIDPIGLRVVIEGDPKTKKRIADDLKKLCPDIVVSAGGNVTCPPKPDKPTPGCALKPPPVSPSACKMLCEMADNKAKDFKLRYNPKVETDDGKPTKGRFFPIYDIVAVDPDQSQSVTNEDGSTRDVENWEVLWHELVHAHRDIPDERIGDHGNDEAEVRRIVNKFYDEYNKRKPADAPNIPPRAMP